MNKTDKQSNTASLQDVIVYLVKGISQYACRARMLGQSDRSIDEVTVEALALTVTDVSLSEEEYVAYINDVLAPTLAKAKELYVNACRQRETQAENLSGPAEWSGGATSVQLQHLGGAIAIIERAKCATREIVSLHALLTSALKGLSVYGDQARKFGCATDDIYTLIHNALDYLIGNYQTQEELLWFCMETGKVTFITLRQLSMANSQMIDGLTEKQAPEKRVKNGLEHSRLSENIDKIVELLKAKKIQQLHLLGGCFSGKDSRTAVAEVRAAAASDSLLLTFGCKTSKASGKSFGDIDGLPRILEVGECNDAYGALRFVRGLADKLEQKMIELPVTVNIFWTDPRSVAILLTFLSLDFKNVRVGGRLPAFATSELMQLLSTNYGVKTFSAERDELESIFTGASVDDVSSIA